jgi:hypothetical protein
MCGFSIFFYYYLSVSDTSALTHDNTKSVKTNKLFYSIEESKDRQNTTDFCVMQTLLVLRRHVSAFVGHLQVSKLEEK